MIDAPFTRHDQIVEFLYKHPSWFLEHCQGSTLDSEWWWVRNKRKTYQTIRCNGNSAMAATKKLIRRNGKYFAPKEPRT